MKRKGIWIFVVILLLAAVGVGGYVFLNGRRQAAASTNSLQTSPVLQGTMTTSVLATGSVRAIQSVSLAWQAGGIVDQVMVKTGDKVSANQVLATLKPDSLSQNVISAQADLANAQKNLDDLLNSQVPAVQAKAAVEAAQKAVDDYTINFPMTQAQAQAALAKAQDNLTTMQDRRDALNVSRASQADIDAAHAAYILAQQDVDRAQAAANQLTNLSKEDPQRAMALTRLADTEKRRDAALATLNWYEGKPSEQDIATADANLAQAQAALAQAQYNWERVKDGPNATDLAMLKAQLADTQRAYERIKDGPDPADVAAAQARVAAAQAAVNQSTIQAPFDGVVTDVQVLPGDQATNGKAAFRIDTMNRLLVDLQVSEVDVPSIKLDQPVNMTFDAIPEKAYEGKVTEVSMVGAATQGIVQFGVTVEFTNPDENVRPGMTASVSIVTQKKTDVLMVPNRAIHVQNGQRYVFVLFEGKQVQTPVTVGLTNETNSEVTSQGLHEGDEVVIPTTSTTTNSNRPFGGMFGGMGR